MPIRQATEEDISKLVTLDKEMYGETGATEEYFKEKLQNFPEGILVVEDDNRITGFAVFEPYEKDKTPNTFQNLTITESLDGKWMFIIAFTTATNYKDKEEDKQLLLIGEAMAKEQGFNGCCVELSKDHPFEINGVFDFWKENGYKIIGEIEWVAGPDHIIPCHFLKKSFN